MPFPMKIQPIDSRTAARTTDSAKPAQKSRLKRLFERQFPGVLKIAPAEKLVGETREKDRDDGEPEPSSLCLAKMVQNFMEETATNEKSARCGRRRCNCFNGNCSDSDDDDLDFYYADAVPTPTTGDTADILKGLVPCASVAERNLLADASKIAEESKIGKSKDDCRRILTDGLRSLGYDSSICKSRWEKSPSIPAGEYEYVDVIVNGERLLVDVDFRSEFEIARSTKGYRAVLQSLPSIFVGTADRLRQIVAVVSEAARVSLKKKGLHIPPWRKPEYMAAKWLSPYHRATDRDPDEHVNPAPIDPIPPVHFSADLDDEKTTSAASPSPWQPPAVKPRPASGSGAKVVTGLASVLGDEP
ncbi:hypothetical protein IHE45_15G060900 [Dioscorea alata]|uniref:Uncharacterized protein n=2 Tax=Dioscorea alata TaxID=55571 RepID=A0ACB7ULQ1_DIOAL|nr:hypothetical protein IHE45_15G060900 [Dioscorea alata]KAH7661403.1 hypothetical protein IHE45_15G060900 [Dioscorea alata]